MNQPIRILYIEDNPLDRELVGHSLEADCDAFALTEVASFSALEQTLAKDVFDIILSDFNILGIDGLQIFDFVKSKNLQTPFIIVTESGSEETAVESMKRGASDYIVKTPKCISRLPLVIREALEKRKLEQLREQAVEELRTRNKQLHFLANHAPVFTAQCDRNQRYVFANESYAKLFGFSENDLVGMYVWDVIGKEAYTQAKPHIENVLAGQTAEYDLEFLSQSGSMHILHVRYAPEYDVSGRTIGFIAAILDVTERKRAEKTANENKANLQTILQSTADGLLAIGMNNQVLFANQRFVDMWRIPREIFESGDDGILLDYVIEQLIDPLGFLAKVQELYNSTASSFDTLDFKDGRVFERLSNPIMSGEKHEGRVWSFRDISARRQAEEALKIQHELFQEAFAISPVSTVLAKLPEEIIIDVNPAFERIIGYTRGEAIGKSVQELRIWVDPSERSRAAKILFENGKVHDCEFAFRTKSNEIGYGIYHSQIVNQSDGQYVFSQAMDITERKKSEDALKRAEGAYRNLVESVKVIVWRGNPKTFRFTFVSQEAETLLGYPTDMWIDEADFWISHIHSEDRERVISLCVTAIEEKENHEFEYRMTAFDGRVVWLRDIISVVVENEIVTEVVGVMVDITERRQAEEAQRISEEKYRTLIDTMNEGLGVQDRDGLVTFMNKRACEMLGYELDELLGKPLDYLFDPENLKILREQMLLRKQGVQRNYEIAWQCKNGEKIHTIIAPNTHYNRAGEIIESVAVFTDITERKQAEELIRLSEERFRQIAETMSGAFWLTDADKKQMMYISPSYETIWGRSTSDLYESPQDWLESIHSDDRDRVIESMKRQGLGSYDEEYRIVRPDGEIRWVHERAFPIRDSEGNIYRIAGVAEDVTKEKQAEEALQRSEEQFRLIAENVADMILVYDVDGKNIYTSPSYYRLLGENGELQGADFLANIHSDDHERLRAVFRETVATGIGSPMEFRLIAKDNSVRFIEAQGSVICDANGNVVNVLAVSRDITEKKRIEEQILRSQRLESIGTLAGGIAHDLNNILTPILLGVSILKLKSTDKQVLDTIAMIETVTLRGSNLIKQVLGFARGIKGEHIALQLYNVVEEIERIIQQTFPKTIVSQVKIPSDLPMITADPTQVHQVLMNLCVNARDAMPNGGTLEISAETEEIDEQYSRMQIMSKPGRYVAISIVDEGSGIPPAVLDRIFEPFYTTKEVGKGTGLGLSTVLAIMRGHGGFVNVYSELNKGTTFKIYFPIETGMNQTKFTESEESIVGRGENILLVDDEESIRNITKTMLESRGYTVISASDGVEGIALYVQNKASTDLVITDMSMPIMDGAALIRALQKVNPSVKILAVSGLKQNDKNLEGVVFLHKPYTSEKLLATISDLLRN